MAVVLRAAVLPRSELLEACWVSMCVNDGEELLDLLLPVSCLVPNSSSCSSRRRAALAVTDNDDDDDVLVDNKGSEADAFNREAIRDDLVPRLAATASSGGRGGI